MIGHLGLYLVAIVQHLSPRGATVQVDRPTCERKRSGSRRREEPFVSLDVNTAKSSREPAELQDAGVELPRTMPAVPYDLVHARVRKGTALVVTHIRYEMKPQWLYPEVKRRPARKCSGLPGQAKSSGEAHRADPGAVRHAGYDAFCRTGDTSTMGFSNLNISPFPGRPAGWGCPGSGWCRL